MKRRRRHTNNSNSGSLLPQQQQLVGRPSYDSVHNNNMKNHRVTASTEDKLTPDRNPPTIPATATASASASASASVLTDVGGVLDSSSPTDERSFTASIYPSPSACSTEEEQYSGSIITSLSLHGWRWREEEKVLPPKKRRLSLEHWLSSLIKHDDSYGDETSSGSSRTPLFVLNKGGGRGGERKRRMVSMSALLRRTDPNLPT